MYLPQNCGRYTAHSITKCHCLTCVSILTTCRLVAQVVYQSGLLRSPHNPERRPCILYVNAELCNIVLQLTGAFQGHVYTIHLTCRSLLNWSDISLVYWFCSFRQRHSKRDADWTMSWRNNGTLSLLCKIIYITFGMRFSTQIRKPFVVIVSARRHLH